MCAREGQILWYSAEERDGNKGENRRITQKAKKMKVSLESMGV